MTAKQCERVLEYFHTVPGQGTHS